MTEPTDDDIRDRVRTPSNVGFNIPGMGSTAMDSMILRSLTQGIIPTRARGMGMGRGPLPAGVADNLPEVHQPNKVALPTAPTAPKKSEWDEQKPFLMALAMLASAFTRQPAVAAMNAMAGMMKGEREGKQQDYQNARAEYQDQLSKALNEQKQELEQYQASYRNRALSWSERMAEMRATAVKRGHGSMLQVLDKGDPGTFLGQQAKAYAALSPAKQKAKWIGDFIEANPDMTYDKAEVAYMRHKESQKEEVKGDKPLTLAQEKAKAVEELVDRHKDDPNYSRAQAIREVEERGGQRSLMSKANAEVFQSFKDKAKQEHPEWSDSQVTIEANRQFQLSHKQPEGLGWTKLSPGLQSNIKGFGGGVEDDWKTGQFTLSVPAQRRLESAAEVINVSERVADFVSTHPWAVGVLAKLQTSLKFDPITDSTIEEARSGVDRLADENTRRLEDFNARLPTGERVNQTEVGDAAVLNKMLLQLALNDAASNSANGQGGTVYLDKQFRGQVYDQLANPLTMLRFMRERQEDSNIKWQNQDPRMDWHKRTDRERPLLTKGPGEMYESVLFHTYDHTPAGELPKALHTAQTNKLVTPALAQAVALSKTFRNRTELEGWARERATLAQQGGITQQQLKVDMDTAAILLRQMFGVR